jgi:hypothetical protein
LGTISVNKLPDTVILRDFVASERETTRLPVRSALFKQRTGGLVVRWVTTSENPLLYVFDFFFEFSEDIRERVARCFVRS